VAIVLANRSVSTTTGWPVGSWCPDLTHPYFIFKDKGYEIEAFGPDGGKCEADAMSEPNDESALFARKESQGNCS